MKFKIKEIAELVQAKNDWSKWADVEISSVEFDNRKVSEGSLFIPLQGGARDGHDFVEGAFESHATASLWAENVGSEPKDKPVLVVSDTLQAFQEIAKYYLAKVGAKVVGVTGSNGKTTTKDMLDGVLSQGFKTHKTQGNYNNEIGLPYTILQMATDTEVVVLEMGMTGFGEIEELSLLTTPDVAAITMIGESHLEFLGTRQGIAKAKMEITAGLKQEGLLVAPGFEPLLADLLTATTQQVMTFGLTDTCDVVGTIISENRTNTVFKTNKTAEVELQIPVLGSYNVSNALIAVSVGTYFDLTIEQIVRGLASMNLTQSRTEWLIAKNGAAVLSDVYNANPTAMSLVLDTVSELPVEGKKIAVLADMGELGPDWEVLHKGMADHLDPNRISEVYLFGPMMKSLATSLKEIYPSDRMHHYDLADKEQLALDLEMNLKSDDMVVLKGSNSMKLIEIVERITEK
ncbi:UDP-N-acetylmuramoyl-tripeptide--D-alanyl-D-alanine ligase [Vagococcus coleopterorum]|uniref:UDP-N-acetylmuramoyl-tripeptide--D-alanyl-D-alanine ligase n=1 Tax=Vagococcus coleopterorum TaxID=2714946 RepID=A0A6G8AM26_9ENTE|nr:UDP-N-acetylmuramoyl-tripeptide--D-alanyl-D-alanine ligase [Vagococcus coleopterorum]QIL46131.1 UDP-N-acetylmuramoyl-tripeptide--D-alanyl-D-alanine ligase [Vagococcus coleopterorum]